MESTHYVFDSACSIEAINVLGENLISASGNTGPHIGSRHRLVYSAMGRLAELAGDVESGGKSHTFVFQDEGHTLGNALRSIIAQYPEVQFCGYTVPHPAETRMHFRIQATSGRAVDVLRKGLGDLESACGQTIQSFEVAWENHQQRSAADTHTSQSISTSSL